MNMVILAPEYPASDVIELLSNPTYGSRLTYVARGEERAGGGGRNGRRPQPISLPLTASLSCLLF